MDLEPSTELALRTRLGSIDPHVSRFTRPAKELVFSRTVKGVTKTYQSNVFYAVLWFIQINPSTEHAAWHVFNTDHETYVSSRDDKEAPES